MSYQTFFQHCPQVNPDTRCS